MTQRVATLISVLLVGATLLPAPASAGTGLTIGALGGVNMTTFSGDTPPSSSWKPRSGYQGGGYLDVVISPHVTLTGQVMFMRKSPILETKLDEVDENGEAFTEQTKAEIDYIVVPVLAQYVFGEGKTNFYIEGGVEFSFMQDAQLLRGSNPSEDITSLVSSSDLAAALGLGAKSKWGKFDWFAGLRFTMGLQNVAMGDPIEGSVHGVVWKSRGTQLLVGIGYPILN